MNGALSGLTNRGRALLAGGVTAILMGLLFGETDLVRLGVFLAALPLISAAVVGRTRYRLSCVRRLEPARVPVGRTAEVVLQVSNLSRLPTGMMMVEDTVPYTLGGRPRFVLDRVSPGRSRAVRYPVRGEVRGRYVVGPLAIRLADPFGLVELTRAFATVDTLTVTPRVQPLPEVQIGGEWVGGGDSRSRAVAAYGADDAAVREYHQGDDLRRVHWRSTAHRGDLMVRREEQPWQSHAALLLDTRTSAHRGDGPGSSFEWAVDAVASVATHLVRSGYGLRLATDAGSDIEAGSGSAAESTLLDCLADVGASPNRSLAGLAGAIRHGSEGLVVAVLGRLDTAEAELVARARVGAVVGVAVLIDSGSWVDLPPRLAAAARAHHDGTVRMLLAGGWRVLEARHGSSMPALWPLAASQPSVVRASVPGAP